MFPRDTEKGGTFLHPGSRLYVARPYPMHGDLRLQPLSLGLQPVYLQLWLSLIHLRFAKALVVDQLVLVNLHLSVSLCEEPSWVPKLSLSRD
jgi:hypothetical protein